MPLSGKDENGLLDGVNAAAIDGRISLVHAFNKQTGDPVLMMCCTFYVNHKPQIIPIAEIIVGRDLDIYEFPEEVRDLMSTPSSPGIDVGIPGFDTL